MDINRMEHRKEMSKYKAAFDSKMDHLEDAILDMQKIEVEMIRDGGGLSQLDPL